MYPWPSMLVLQEIKREDRYHPRWTFDERWVFGDIPLTHTGLLIYAHADETRPFEVELRRPGDIAFVLLSEMQVRVMLLHEPAEVMRRLEDAITATQDAQ